MPEPVEVLQFSNTRNLDLYRVAGMDRPTVICVHGGGFVSGSKADNRCIQAAELLSQAGFNCASVSYSLAENSDRFSMWPKNLLDVAQAVAYLHERSDQLNISMQRFAFLGFSAGCCLSNLYMQGGEALFRELGFELPFYRPAALVGLYGPYDFSIRQPERRSSNESVNRLHSPRYWLKKNEGLAPPPVLHIHGDLDDIVFLNQHQAFESDCEEKDYPFRGIVARGFGHSFAIRDSDPSGNTLDLTPDIISFLEPFLLKAIS